MGQPLVQSTLGSVDDETGDPGTATSSAAADQDAATIWASLQRLQDQSFGLGSAAEQQLGRALSMCRDLRGCKVCVCARALSPVVLAKMLFTLFISLELMMLRVKAMP